MMKKENIDKELLAANQASKDHDAAAAASANDGNTNHDNGSSKNPDHAPSTAKKDDAGGDKLDENSKNKEVS